MKLLATFFIVMMTMMRCLMSKEEMIEQIRIILKANEDNPHCSVEFLVDMIKEVIEEVSNG